MIEKDPSNRYDGMKALTAELKSISLKLSLSKEQVVSKRAKLKAAAVFAALACVGIAALMYLRPWVVQEKGLSSIAVLPFADMSPEKDQEYFCDGMAEELITALTQIKDLRVIARTSAFSYKGKDVKARDIGSQLNVATILEGSVRKADNRLRVTVQLVDTKGGHHLWSERYDRDMGDVFAIQDEITLAIVDKLRPKLLGEQEAKLTKRQPVDIEAYNLYLKGLFFWNKRGEMNLKKAIEYFEQAIEKDPNYAPAYAGLASSYSHLPIYSPLPSKQAVRKARELALKALEIDKTLPEAHAALGFINMWYDWDWAGAERAFKRAIELNPGYALAHKWYSDTFMFRARFDEALKEREQALELDPVSVLINKDLGTGYYFAGQFDRAIDALKRAIEMDPSRMHTHLQLGEVYLAKSMYEEALMEFQKEREVSGGAHAWAEMYTGWTYVEMGKADEAQKVLDKLLERSKTEYVSPFTLACFHFVLGRNDEGFKWLNKAYEERDLHLGWLKIEPLFDSVRSDPRYTALLKKMNLDK
jgi:serine/threonine-protein kinase